MRPELIGALVATIFVLLLAAMITLLSVPNEVANHIGLILAWVIGGICVLLIVAILVGLWIYVIGSAS